MKWRKRQCKACPWRKDTVPDRDIPNQYCVDKHKNLKNTIRSGMDSLTGPLRIMACHETHPDEESPCTGWLANQLGPGNNIALRFLVYKDSTFPGIELVGEQHECFEDTIPKGK